MYARIHFVSPGSPERYSWVIDTSLETVDHWRHAHPEAEDLVVARLDDQEGLEALYWQKCLYHDVFFERSACQEVRANGQIELLEILELASRLAPGRASELWDRCMEFRFGSDPIARRPLIMPATMQVSGRFRSLRPANANWYEEEAGTGSVIFLPRSRSA